jgi:Ca-activated chloride channel family protein
MRVFGTRLLCVFSLLTVMAGLSLPRAAAGQQPDQPVFRAGVDLVSVAAVVRDKQGRTVRSLTRDDFELFDAGQSRTFVDVQSDANAPASVALLVDGSGSMAAGTTAARHLSELLLSQLTDRDEAALMSFDTRLLTLRPFTSDLDRVRRGFRDLDAFGASSIYDAIAGAAGMVAERTARRRAIVVITDGADNASTYKAREVAWIASAIDVPIYVFAVGHDVPRAADARDMWKSPTPLMQLARGTGGDFFYAGTAADREAAVARVIDELRHQYLMSFEPLAFGGLHRIEIRTRNNDFKVRSRQWYAADFED